MKIFVYIISSLIVVYSSISFSKVVEITGVVQNPSMRSSSPEISVYMPGVPFVKNSIQSWGGLAKSTYDENSGAYTVSIEIPDNYNDEVIVAATYLDTSFDDIEAYVTYPVLVNNQQNIILNISLPVFSGTESGVVIKLTHNKVEYNYRRPYRCVVANESVSENGQMFFLSNHDYLFNKNKINNVLPGKYRVLCAIKNLSSPTPATVRKVFNIEVLEINVEFNLDFDNSGEVF